jgi:peptide/nickel transport system substrate-binding protein
MKYIYKNMNKSILIILIFTSVLGWNCKTEEPSKPSRVVIGVEADAETLNPLFAVSLIEGQINEILYLSLVKHNWDESAADIISSPLLCEKWEWNQDSTSITFSLRDNAFWSDGVKVTAEDIVYSFDLYSDPEVNSKFYSSYDNLFTEINQHIDLKKSFEIISPTKLIINFKPGSMPSLFDVDMPILPKHFFSKFFRKELSTINIKKDLVTNGPYTLSSWRKNEAIILKAVENSFLYDPSMIKELIFKIVPDENSRITQLKRGEIDLIEDVNVEVVDELKKQDYIQIVARIGRDYDYIGWNNIDPALYSQSKAINPNKFFGSVNVRKALSYAINKEEILKEYLQGYGELSFGPVSPIFKLYYNERLKPYEFNPGKAKEILTSEGWIDSNQDGVIEKNNINFSFKLYIASGNPRREYAATVVKNNLKAVGIDVSIETMEMSAFINKLFERELDAFMAGWTIPIPLDVQPYWHSYFERSPFNLVGFSNVEVDKILDQLEQVKKVDRKVLLYKKIQELLHQNEPVTFLYWLEVKTAYNKRIRNIVINPLGAVQQCWDWRINGN